VEHAKAQQGTASGQDRRPPPPSISWEWAEVFHVEHSRKHERLPAGTASAGIRFSQAKEWPSDVALFHVKHPGKQRGAPRRKDRRPPPPSISWEWGRSVPRGTFQRTKTKTSKVTVWNNGFAPPPIGNGKRSPQEGVPNQTRQRSRAKSPQSMARRKRPTHAHSDEKSTPERGGGALQVPMRDALRERPPASVATNSMEVAIGVEGGPQRSPPIPKAMPLRERSVSAPIWDEMRHRRETVPRGTLQETTSDAISEKPPAPATLCCWRGNQGPQMFHVEHSSRNNRCVGKGASQCNRGRHSVRNDGPGQRSSPKGFRKRHHPRMGGVTRKTGEARGRGGGRCAHSPPLSNRRK
jgi:hypothetical protein